MANTTYRLNMTTNYSAITKQHLEQLMVIENACHSHPWSEQTMLSCMGGRYFGFMLKQEQTLRGFYIGEYVAGEATLMDVCVSPDHQGKGYGKHLLNHFSEQAKLLGASQLFLEVRAKNISALMMYINCGFIEVGRRTGYYPSKIGYEDAIVMKRKL
ncbi:ribosomal protein S18-alanine N-acetyltransferase [Thalassotalea piscium]|uniref:[Ribosomal protein bS18]-alanine N-acetyltransferase n=1 Tax=Thalassotalea piscium TaxID=1230533 RepID=A0A7X0NJZ4_9GAMM|nr:ribosomal protein S18-alanine N-acetyltransferase [Thalassotalea piscium]MBB6544833.1 ribosomal-protein-alanine N-acetyltransferase [Thalassotalea piscium]